MIGAIVLAAGESRRMGVSKTCLPFAGKTVIEHIVLTLERAGVRDTVVVVGHAKEAIEALLQEYAVQVVFNPDYSEGMLSSLRAGLRQASSDWDGVMVALGDQPSIREETVSALMSRFSKSPDDIHVPVYGGRRGHPLLFPARYRAVVLQQYDDTGLRGLLRAHPDRVRELDVDSDTVLRDMDYPEDYERELRDFETRESARDS